MKYEEIDMHILSSKSNAYEQAHGIKTIKILTKGNPEDEIVYKIGVKSDESCTLFVCFKTNRKFDNWLYLALTEKQIKILDKSLKIQYDGIDEYNRNKRKKIKL